MSGGGEKALRGERMTAREAIEAEAAFLREAEAKAGRRPPSQDEMVRTLREDVIRQEKLKERR